MGACLTGHEYPLVQAGKGILFCLNMWVLEISPLFLNLQIHIPYIYPCKGLYNIEGDREVNYGEDNAFKVNR